MGHLGNPISFRLSYRKVWENNWFIKNLYYPEFINSMINLKEFLYYYLSRKYALYSGITLSHFNLYKFYKNYIFKLYIYHIDLEKSSVNFLNKMFESYYKFLYSRTWGCYKYKRKLDIFLKILHNADLFVFIYLCFLYFFVNKKQNYRFKYYNILKKDREQKFYVKKLFKIIKYNILNSYKYISKYKKQRKYLKCWKEKFLFILKYWKKKLKNKKYLLNSELCLKLKYLKDISKLNIINIKKFKKFFKFLQIKNRYYFFKKKKKFLNLHLDLGIKFRKFKLSIIYFFLYILKKANFKKFKTYKSFSKKWKKSFHYLKIFKYISRGNLHFINLLKYFNVFLVNLYELKKKQTKNRFNFRTTTFHFCYNYIYIKLVKKLIFKYFNMLKYILYIINSKIKNIIFHIYFIPNELVSARFIARYLALRLRRNFILKRVIFTIKRQLCRSMWIDKKAAAYKLYNYKLILRLQIKRLKIWFKKLYMYFFLLLKKNIYNLYIKNDFFGIFYIYIYKKYIYGNLNKLILYNLMIQIFDLFYLFKNKCFKKLWFYGFDLNIIYNKFINLLYFKNALIFKKKINKTVLLLSNFFYKNYINYVFLKFMCINILKINYRNIRKHYRPKYNINLMGFKLYFRGRFSRKQRASKVWMQQGKVPLNTLKANIDYALYTIPLKNSLISVKLWLYRKKPLVSGFRKFIQI